MDGRKFLVCQIYLASLSSAVVKRGREDMVTVNFSPVLLCLNIEKSLMCWKAMSLPLLHREEERKDSLEA